MSLPRRSQSALEYMMTYGWAILVIVIVAAVLYSLGIFSPSSSLSTTITGFSNLGTVNAVCLGGTSFTISMGDSTGYSINITQINLTSSSGKTTYSPNILIQPNSIQTVTVPSSSLCSPGARYSVSAVISYLEPGQILPGPYTSTGTVAGTAASPPSSATSYEPLTIANTQNQGTPSPFQQMINVTSSSPGWAGISSSPFGQNVEFFSATGQILDSWLENYTSTHAIWWVKLTSSIPAGSKQTIYMGFAPTSTNLFNTNNVGEAPQLSSIYAEYDDGANVFIQYGGKSWSSFTFVGGTWTTANGYLQQTATTGSYSNGPAALIESTNYSATGQYVLGMAFNYTTEAVARLGIIAVATPITTSNVCGYRFIGQQGDNGAGFISFLNDGVAWVVNNNYQGAVSTDYTMVITDAGGTWSGNLYLGYTESGTPLTSLAATAYTTNNAEGTNIGYVGISAAYSSSVVVANPINVMWFYMRAYPPNGVMPSVSFGSVS